MLSLKTNRIGQSQMQSDYHYESLFPFVNKPSRYVGNEWNAFIRSPEEKQGRIGWCLCFPDLYETGFANMGASILYQLLNRRDDAYAERAYAVGTDLADLLRQKRWPLFSLETRVPLSQFDVVGFSLPYELCYTNVLEMLDLAGIPLESAQRGLEFPLIIGGGPCSVNPEPLADFFDVFVIGDGEEIVGEITETLQNHKTLGSSKASMLEALARIPGIYVPSLYNVEYAADGRVQKVSPNKLGIAEKVAYRKSNLSQIHYGEHSFPIAPVVPFVQTVHDRLNVEIQRGCPWRCRFCQAGFTYGKYRERSAEELRSIILEGLSHTGYDALTLAGLSAADHRQIVPLLTTLSQELTPRRIAIGLPSTRADRFTLALAELLQTVRRQSVTFAPEAGSERLRRVIRKELEEAEIRATLSRAKAHGWKSVKLYFMYGLPTETEEDLSAMIDLVRFSHRENPGLALTITLSPFVPKPHTPYQWHEQNNLAELESKLLYLKKNLKAEIRAHNLHQIVVEGVLSRGDRRTGQLLKYTWKRGAKFDEWSEFFKWDLWQEAFVATGLTPEFFSQRTRSAEEVLPWDHLEAGPEKRVLWNDYQTALKQAVEPLPPQHLKPRPEVPTSSAEPIQKAQDRKEATVQRWRIKFSRYGAVRFLTHLEQIEMIRRIFRRAGLGVAYTAGFHPQMKAAFGPAISVGYESSCEYVDVDLTERVEPILLEKNLAAQMPAGFALQSVKRIPLFFPSLEAVINFSDAQVVLDGIPLPPQTESQWQEQLQNFLSQPAIKFEKIKQGKKGAKKVEIDVKALLHDLHWVHTPAQKEQNPVLAMRLLFGPGKNVKPEKVVGLLLNLDDNAIKNLRVLRQAFWMQKSDGTLVEP